MRAIRPQLQHVTQIAQTVGAAIDESPREFIGVRVVLPRKIDIEPRSLRADHPKIVRDIVPDQQAAGAVPHQRGKSFCRFLSAPVQIVVGDAVDIHR